MSGKRRPSSDDHRGGRIARHPAGHIYREASGRPGWTVVRQGGDTWHEHDACGRTFLMAIDRRRHEATCG